MNKKDSAIKLCDLLFEKANQSQADILVVFEQTVSDPRLYGKPLDFINATNEILNNNFYFIKNNDELVGSAAYCVRADGSCYISNMAVAPAWRGHGIGRAAMEFLIKKCDHAWRIDLTTHPENFRSIPLYEAFGFVVESRIENYYGDGEPRLVMAKKNII